ncbi:hypothetical protein [Sulfuricurvum sp.]|uniref:hypothetical protein n=1 Tax=Sulfuricurvum sp. TaxID=2025608 RepID=UPI003563D325
MYYTALYLSSDIENEIIEFQVEIEGCYPDTKEGFHQLTKAFTIAADTFGKTEPFPNEILESIHENCNRLERLLQDTEFIPEKTYYLKMPATQMVYSLSDVDVYRLYGINESHCLLEAIEGEMMCIVGVKEVWKVFGKV